MIRRDDKDGWILLTQYDHAVLAGMIMEHWGNGRFSRPRPYEEVIFAVREHDRGWKEWDSSPKVNPENAFPANFMEMESPDQTRIWSGSFYGHSGAHPYASALIALHFARFNKKLLSRNPSDENAKNLEAEIFRFVSEKLCLDSSDLESGHIPDEVGINLRLLQIGDIISLALCHGWTSMEITDAPVDYEGASVILSLESEDGLNYTIMPYPFSEDVLKLRITGRKLASKEFSSDRDLRRELEGAPYITLDFTIGKG